jgi:hypothetical protein
MLKQCFQIFNIDLVLTWYCLGIDMVLTWSYQDNGSIGLCFTKFLFEPGNQDCREQAGDQTDQGFERGQYCWRDIRYSIQRIRQGG